MDDIGKVYLVISVIVFVCAMVCFWFISRKAPKGTLLVIGISLWVIGQAISSKPVREIKVIGGLCTMVGFIGGIFGLIGLFRKKDA